MNLNFDFNGKTTLAKWWLIVKENFDTVKSNFTAVKTTLNTHINADALPHKDGSVRTTHIKDGNVTRAKLASEVQTQLYDFQVHINNPSQEIAYRSVTKDKLSHEINSDLEKTMSTAEFINALYGCKVFLWTKNEIICPNENFPSELDIYENDKAIDEDFAEDVWYLYKHDGTFSIDCFTFIGYDTKTYYGLSKPVGLEGMYALKFHTTTPAQGIGIASGTCEVIKLAEGDFESMINGGSAITVDSELSDTSTNPVQNKVVNEALNEKMDYYCNYAGFKNIEEALDAINGKLDWECNYAGFDNMDEALQAINEKVDYNNPYPGFKTMDEVCQAVLDLQNSDTNSDSLITVDGELSNTSENPVQNKVVNEALNKKMDWECNYGGFNNMDEALTAILDLQDRVSALEG